MAQQVLMPKQGNSVETCIILEWKIAEGESVSEGDILCEAETDKATIEIESTASGILLKQLYNVDDEVPVLVPMAIVGEKGEDITGLTGGDETANSPEAPAAASDKAETMPESPQETTNNAAQEAVPSAPAAVTLQTAGSGELRISPRARTLAATGPVNPAGIPGSGPYGRIIERDIAAVLEHMTPAAAAAMASDGLKAPVTGSGIGGRVRTQDLVAETAPQPAVAVVPGEAAVAADENSYREIPVRSVRKITAERMFESISTTCQLTLHATADAVHLKEMRARLKRSDPELGMNTITINDLILFAAAKTIIQFPYINSHFLKEQKVIREFAHVHLGLAVDTERGLMVPVIRNADLRSLKGISAETAALVAECRSGKIDPEKMAGGTFTVTNLGAMGIDRFTPVLNTPQSAILGVGGIELKPVDNGSGVEFIPHITLSLTFDHQSVDGAPAARFLKALCENIKNIDLLLMQ